MDSERKARYGGDSICWDTTWAFVALIGIVLTLVAGIAIGSGGSNIWSTSNQKCDTDCPFKLKELTSDYNILLKKYNELDKKNSADETEWKKNKELKELTSEYNSLLQKYNELDKKYSVDETERKHDKEQCKSEISRLENDLKNCRTSSASQSECGKESVLNKEKLASCEEKSKEKLENCEKQSTEKLNSCKKQFEEKLTSCEEQSKEKVSNCEKHSKEKLENREEQSKEKLASCKEESKKCSEEVTKQKEQLVAKNEEIMYLTIDCKINETILDLKNQQEVKDMTEKQDCIKEIQELYAIQGSLKTERANDHEKIEDLKKELEKEKNSLEKEKKKNGRCQGKMDELSKDKEKKETEISHLKMKLKKCEKELEEKVEDIKNKKGCRLL